MSAGSSTAVGGRIDAEESVGQFDISNGRSLPEMAVIRSRVGE